MFVNHHKKRRLNALDTYYVGTDFLTHVLEGEIRGKDKRDGKTVKKKEAATR